MQVILTCAEALSLHEKPLMTDNDTVLELYAQGISAHDLRLSYVNDLCGDNPYLRLSRQEIARDKRFIERMSSLDRIEQEFRLLDLVLFALEEAEPKAVSALLSGQVIGLGLTDAQNLSPNIVPPLQWPFLTIDFEKGSASGAGLNYVGLHFVSRDKLTEDQVQNLEATSKSTAVRLTEVTQSRSLRDLNISTWEDLRLRFLKDNFVEVGGPEQKMRFSLAEMGLMNRTKGEPNASCAMLFQMARHVIFIPNKGTKQKISTLRRTLQKALGLSGGPFHIEGGRGYVPRFQLIDDRDAGDRRAEDEAGMVSYQEIEEGGKEMEEGLFHLPSAGRDQAERPYKEDEEMQGDEASVYIRKRTGR